MEKKKESMNKKDNDGFNLSKAKKISNSRRAKLIAAAEAKLGRPLKAIDDKYKPISIKLHPDVYEWAKKEADEQGLGYQTVINETLLGIAKKKSS